MEKFENNHVPLSKLRLNRETDVRLELCDVPGALVWSRELRSAQPGNHNITLGTDDLPSGSYLLQLRTEQGVTAKWVMIVR